MAFKPSFAAAAVAVCLIAPVAHAQEWPSKPVRIIVPVTAGGVIDVVARTMAQRFTATFGQSFVVDNRPGANGIIGVDLAAKSTPDGHTLLAATNGMLSMNPAVFPKLPFNALRDLAPITIVISAPFALFAHPSLPVKSVKDVVALAKSRPGEIPYGSFGPASIGHFGMELFMLRTGIRMTHVPYKGGAPLAGALAAGEVSLAFDSIQNESPSLQGKRVRPLALAGTKRLALMPDLPTLTEVGVKDADVGGWYALLAPAGTPRAIINRLYEDTTAAFKSPELRQRYESLGSEIVLNAPEQFGAQIKNEIEIWTRTAREAKITVN